MRAKIFFTLLSAVVVVTSAVGAFQVTAAAPSVSSPQAYENPSPKFSTAVAFDKTPALRDLVKGARLQARTGASTDELIETAC